MKSSLGGNQEAATLYAAGGILLVVLLLPLATVVASFVGDDAAQGLSRTLGNSSTWWLLLRSLAIAFFVTLGALTIGVPCGALLGGSDCAGRRWALLLMAFPMFLPPFLLSLGWFYLFGKNGFLGSAWTSELLFSRVGLVVVLSFSFAPIVTLLTALGVMAVDRSLVEAGALVASPRRVLSHIVLPLVRPWVALAALLVFAFALSEVSVPMFLRVQTYPAAVFTRLGGIEYSPGEATALSLPLLVVGLGLLAMDRKWIRHSLLSSFSLPRGGDAPLGLGRLRRRTSIAVWGVVGVFLLPLLALGGKALFVNWQELWMWLDSSMETSLQVSALAATLICLLGIAVGHPLRNQSKIAGGLDSLAFVGFLVPSSVLGIGLMSAWNRPFSQAIYSGLGILVLGIVARYSVLGIRMFSAVFAQRSPEYEAAAAVFGAGYWRRMRRIVLPMHALDIGFAWLIVFAFCMRDLDTVVMLYPPGLDPLPVRIYSLEANGAASLVAALSAVHVVLTAAVLGLGGLVLHRRRRL